MLEKRIWSGIEVVITGRTRNAFGLTAHVGSNPTRSATSRWITRSKSPLDFPRGIYYLFITAPLPPKGMAALSKEKHSHSLGFSFFACLSPFCGNACGTLIYASKGESFLWQYKRRIRTRKRAHPMGEKRPYCSGSE